MNTSKLPSEFNTLSNTKKKKYIARLIIEESRAIPVAPDEKPFAMVMAGLPGAGKTEFLETLLEQAKKSLSSDAFVRIDLDHIIEIYPNYTPKDYYKFRSQGIVVQSYCVDAAIHGRYNIMLDGTFAGLSGVTIKTVGRLLQNGYIVRIMYMHEKPNNAWRYVCKRFEVTGRPIDKVGFIHASLSLTNNLKNTVKLYSHNQDFQLQIVQQKDLRDKNYVIITSDEEIDNILNHPYTISDTDLLE